LIKFSQKLHAPSIVVVYKGKKNDQIKFGQNFFYIKLYIIKQRSFVRQ